MSIERIENTDKLDQLLSEPTPQAVETLARLDGDLILLGAAGKMGPTLARMARLASDRAGKRRRIIGVARFSDQRLEGYLQHHGVETIRCNLLDPADLAGCEVADVIAMFGMKFGSTGQGRTWAVNCLAPGMICQKYRQSRIVAFSTGNVYGMSPVALGGSVETDPLNAAGDYSMSCVGRERIYEHCSRSLNIPMALLRLNYAAEMRYGVLVDLAQRVWTGLPVNLRMGHFNAIWQADANAAALSALGCVSVPPLVLNIAGPETLSVRRLAEQFATRFDRPVTLEEQESADAYLSNAQLSHRLFGYPRVRLAQMVDWIADWIKQGGETFGKPTHFEVRDGKF